MTAGQDAIAVPPSAISAALDKSIFLIGISLLVFTLFA
ncbi:hypothetical protein Z947_1995 [Sulfitobacter geojensis]|nr:hypothetical protein Z947_1995 [Sulfitobacter geojensis]